nr:glycine-rich RNA-binding protein 7-like [Arachis hypogaea]
MIKKSVYGGTWYVYEQGIGQREGDGDATALGGSTAARRWSKGGLGLQPVASHRHPPKARQLDGQLCNQIGKGKSASDVDPGYVGLDKAWQANEGEWGREVTGGIVAVVSGAAEDAGAAVVAAVRGRGFGKVTWDGGKGWDRGLRVVVVGGGAAIGNAVGGDRGGGSGGGGRRGEEEEERWGKEGGWRGGWFWVVDRGGGGRWWWLGGWRRRKGGEGFGVGRDR